MTKHNPNEGLFSLFSEPITNTVPEGTITLRQLHKMITADPAIKEKTEILRSISDPKKSAAYKSYNFSYATICGEFESRHDSKIIKASRYMVSDIDKQKDVKAIVKRLSTDTVIVPVLVYVSPSGKGVKFVVRISPDLIDWQAASKKMHPLWDAINNYLAKYYSDIILPDAKGNYIDESGTDLSRACFIGHDPEAVLNETALTVLGEAFLKEYGKAGRKHAGQTTGSKRVSRLTTLLTLQNRHCLDQDNHHAQLFKFMCAAKAIGTKAERIVAYINDHIHISPDSSYYGTNKVEYTVNDIFKRYPTDQVEAIFLKPNEFAYDIFLFKYVKDEKAYILSGLCYEGIRQFLANRGYYKRYLSPKFSTYIRQMGQVISEVSTEMLRDVLTKYVDAITSGLSFIYMGAKYGIPAEALRETYLRQSNNIFNETWLEHVSEHTTPLLRDTADTMYFGFKNNLVTITKAGITQMPLNDLVDLCVWETQVIKRDFTYFPDSNTHKLCHFALFLRNVTNNDPLRYKALVTAIGYLMHYYFKPSEGEAVILYDEAITNTDKPMGGTGKGLLANGIREMRSVVKIDGKHFDAGNRFRYEMISPGCQLAWIDDVKPSFDFSILHSALTDGWTIERKHASQFFIEPKDSPKTLICSNSILNGGGTTNSRRQLVYEFSDYYSKMLGRTKKGPIEEVHGCLFFSDDWTDEEWNLFYSYMCDCAFQYLTEGRIPHPEINVGLNRFRQQTNEDFVSWTENKAFVVGERYNTQHCYTSYIGTYYSGQGPSIGQRSFTAMLRLYADFKDWSLNIHSSNGQQYFSFSAKSG